MKCMLCARKSTENEDRQILSIDAQAFELKEFAAKEKLEIVIGAAEPRFRNFARAYLVACGGENCPNYFKNRPTVCL